MYGLLIDLRPLSSGGSYTTAAGQAAAELPLTGKVPQWLDARVFTPTRLTNH